jgi:lipopolysaccharide transport protein LptA
MRAIAIAVIAFAQLASQAVAASAPDAGAAPRKKIDRTAKSGAPERPVKIAADAFDALEGGKRLIWKGKVLIVRDDMRVNCDRLVGEGEDAKHIRKLTCSGNAHMRQSAVANVHPEREAWGEVAVFDNDTAILTVTGSPRGREGENTFQGDRVTFDTRADKLRAEGKVTAVLITPPEREKGDASVPKPDAKVSPEAAVPDANMTPDAGTLGPEAKPDASVPAKDEKEHKQ